jgi:hypothetical protein
MLDDQPVPTGKPDYAEEVDSFTEFNDRNTLPPGVRIKRDKPRISPRLVVPDDNETEEQS